MPTPSPLPLALSAWALAGGISPIEKALEAREDDAKASIFADQQLPYLLMAGGVAATYLIWSLLMPVESTSRGVMVATIVVILQTVVFVPLAMLGALIGVRLFGLSFGEGWPALLKLAAITLGPGALADAGICFLAQLDFDTWHPIMGFLFYMACLGIPLALYYRTDLQETALVVFVQAAFRILLLFGFVAIFPGFFGKLSVMHYPG